MSAEALEVHTVKNLRAGSFVPVTALFEVEKDNVFAFVRFGLRKEHVIGSQVGVESLRRLADIYEGGDDLA